MAVFRTQTGQRPPTLTPLAGRRALRALLSRGGLLAGLAALHAELGDIFQLTLPGFNPIVLVGPEANRFILITQRDSFRWRPESDPVTRLLRQGVLVTDGDQHTRLRRALSPALHKRRLGDYSQAMLDCTDSVTSAWQTGDERDMLVEMRRIALLILMETLFSVDFRPALDPLWPAILRMLAYISPGSWVIWSGLPRPGYARSLRAVDTYLYQIIADRQSGEALGDDLLSQLVRSGMEVDLIRDQILTLLIAGHDTSTALLSWTLYLLGRHPAVLERARAEVDQQIGSEPPGLENIAGLTYLDQVIKETLRLYPPIHIGNRSAIVDLEYSGYRIPAGQRVVYSIYLTQRHPRYWPEPDRFDPDRFAPERSSAIQPYTYLPFGGGARNCIGLAFAQVEVKIILSRLLQAFDLALLPRPVHPHMGATLEPRPAVWMRIRRRAGKGATP